MNKHELGAAREPSSWRARPRWQRVLTAILALVAATAVIFWVLGIAADDADAATVCGSNGGSSGCTTVNDNWLWWGAGAGGFDDPNHADPSASVASVGGGARCKKVRGSRKLKSVVGVTLATVWIERTFCYNGADVTYAPPADYDLDMSDGGTALGWHDRGTVGRLSQCLDLPSNGCWRHTKAARFRMERCTPFRVWCFADSEPRIGITVRADGVWDIYS